MNELLRPTRETHFGSGGAGMIFTDDEEASPQLVTVSSGPYAEHLPVGNMSVGEIRRRFRDRLDIDPRSVAVLDGRDVSDDVVVTAGQVLTFMHRAGERGCGTSSSTAKTRSAAVSSTTSRSTRRPPDVLNLRCAAAGLRYSRTPSG